MTEPKEVFELIAEEIAKLTKYSRHSGRITTFEEAEEICRKLRFFYQALNLTCFNNEIGISTRNEDDVQPRKNYFGPGECTSFLQDEQPKSFVSYCLQSFRKCQPRYVRNILLINAVLYAAFSLLMVTLENESFFNYLGFMFITYLTWLLVTIVWRALVDRNLETYFGKEAKCFNDNEEVTVIRDGNPSSIFWKNVMIGDILKVQPGMNIRVDGVLVKIEAQDDKSAAIRIDEWIYRRASGHSVKMEGKELCCYDGTWVVKGSGLMVVTAVGSNTHLKKGSGGEEKTVQKLKVLEVYPFLKFGIVMAIGYPAILLSRFAFQIFIVENQPWDMKHLQKIVIIMTRGLSFLLDRCIPISLPIYIIWTFHRIACELRRNGIFVRNIMTAQALSFLQSEENQDEPAMAIPLQDIVLSKKANIGKQLRDATTTCQLGVLRVRKFGQILLTLFLVECLSLVSVFTTQRVTAMQELWLAFSAVAALVFFPMDERDNDDDQWKSTIASVFTRTTWKLVVGQFLYQSFVYHIVIFYGPYFWDHDTEDVGTFAFNVFFFMTMSHVLCTRVTRGRKNMFDEILNHWVFCGVLLVLVILQMVQNIIKFRVQNGGLLFSTVPLGLILWMWTIFFGVGALVWGQILGMVLLRRGDSPLPMDEVNTTGHQDALDQNTTTV